MGDWFVIANIPTYFEAKAFNPVESYRLGNNGKIETTFAFNAGATDGPAKEIKATGVVKDPDKSCDMGYAVRLAAKRRLPSNVCRYRLPTYRSGKGEARFFVDYGAQSTGRFGQAKHAYRRSCGRGLRAE